MLCSNFILLCYSSSSQILIFFRSLQEQCDHFRLMQINSSSSSRSQIQTHTNTHTFSPYNLGGRQALNSACISVPPKQPPAQINIWLLIQIQNKAKKGVQSTEGQVVFPTAIQKAAKFLASLGTRKLKFLQ